MKMVNASEIVRKAKGLQSWSYPTRSLRSWSLSKEFQKSIFYKVKKSTVEYLWSEALEVKNAHSQNTTD